MQVEIIIPTVPGREKYLHWALKSCLSNDDNGIVLVSSNGGDPGVREVVASFNSDRIRLVESDTYLPMALHWEFACSHAVGDVVSIIGDDDAIVPGAIGKVIELFNAFPLAECVTHKPAHYYWPDYPIEYCANKYTDPECSGEVEVVKPLEVLKKVIEMREWYGRLPYLYHGFVKREVLDRVRSSEGVIFKRIAPDIYSDFVLAVHISSFIRASYCFTVGGQGEKSNGASFILNTQIGRDFLKDLPEILTPKLSGKSINLQIYEYSRLFIGQEFEAKDIHSTWGMFVLRTLIEAARTSENRDEIVDDLYKILGTEMPPHKLFLYGLLIRLVRCKKVSEIISILSERRQKMLMRRWFVARNLDATNVFDVANIFSRKQFGEVLVKN
jgi:hypothetical protein